MSSERLDYFPILIRHWHLWHHHLDQIFLLFQLYRIPKRNVLENISILELNDSHLKRKIDILSQTADVRFTVKQYFDLLRFKAPARWRWYLQNVISFVIDWQEVITIARRAVCLISETSLLCKPIFLVNNLSIIWYNLNDKKFCFWCEKRLKKNQPRFTSKWKHSEFRDYVKETKSILFTKII